METVSRSKSTHQKFYKFGGASEKMVMISSWNFSFWDYLDTKFRQIIVKSLKEI